MADEKQEFEDDQDDGYRHPGALARTGGVEGLPKAEALESVRENTSFYMRNWLWERLDEKFLLHLKFHPLCTSTCSFGWISAQAFTSDGRA